MPIARATIPAAACRVLGHGARQLAAADLVGGEGAERPVDGPVGEPGQRAGDNFQGPDPAEIGEPGEERHAGLGPAKRRAEGLGRRGAKLGENGVKRGFRRFGKGGLQPVGLARHQAGEIGAAAGRAFEEPAQLGGQPGEAGARFLGPGGVECDRAAGQAGCETHGPTVSAGLAASTVRREPGRNIAGGMQEIRSDRASVPVSPGGNAGQRPTPRGLALGTPTWLQCPDGTAGTAGR